MLPSFLDGFVQQRLPPLCFHYVYNQSQKLYLSLRWCHVEAAVVNAALDERPAEQLLYQVTEMFCLCDQLEFQVVSCTILPCGFTSRGFSKRSSPSHPRLCITCRGAPCLCFSLHVPWQKRQGKNLKIVLLCSSPQFRVNKIADCHAEDVSVFPISCQHWFIFTLTTTKFKIKFLILHRP